MSDRELRATLADLHAQLEASEPLDPALRDELRRTVAEIESHLGGQAADGHSFGERLARLVQRFEGSHPRLAESVNRVVHGLAELGI